MTPRPTTPRTARADRQGKPTPGPFTIRAGVDGNHWFVETARVPRVALFRFRADAERFVAQGQQKES